MYALLRDSPLCDVSPYKEAPSQQRHAMRSGPFVCMSALSSLSR